MSGYGDWRISEITRKLDGVLVELVRYSDFEGEPPQHATIELPGADVTFWTEEQ